MKPIDRLLEILPAILKAAQDDNAEREYSSASDEAEFARHARQREAIAEAVALVAQAKQAEGRNG